MVLNIADAARLSELVRASGLVDEAFYTAAYGPPQPDKQDLVEAFLCDGIPRGYVPSPSFDPLLYGYLTPESRAAGPVAHYLDSGKPFHRPSIESLFPQCRPRILRNVTAWSDPAHVQGCLASASEASDPRSVSFTVAGRQCRMEVPDGRLFIERLSRDDPFAFVRLPHGLWDSLIHRDEARDALDMEPGLAFLSPVQRRNLATRVAGAFLSSNGVFHGSFLDEVQQLATAHRTHPRFHLAVAFQGYPGPDHSLFLGLEPGDQRLLLDTFAELLPGVDRVIDATLWKRMAISGSLSSLAEACRDRHVILVASDLFADLDARWRLARFTHLVIPRSRSHERRWALARQLATLLTMESDRPGPRPVVITQCGGSLAFWLIARMFSTWPDIFFIDLGQALNAWFFDVTALPVLAWMRIYRQRLVRAPGFEGYYRARLRGAFTRWAEELAMPIDSKSHRT